MRYSTRKRTVTNYNEDNAEIWGLEEEEDYSMPAYTPQYEEEEEGDVIESIHDHRRCEGFGKHQITLINFEPNTCFYS